MGSLRSAKRHIAKMEMKKAGLRRICSKTGKRRQGRSWFSQHWREYVPSAKREENPELNIVKSNRGKRSWTMH